jgi:uncharacterized membrane protein
VSLLSSLLRYIVLFRSFLVPQRSQLATRVQAWLAAGIIDSSTADRILAFESSHEQRSSLRWPVFVALLFGGILLAAGVALFVAAHWATLSPAFRFTLVLLMVAVFHVAGALLVESFPVLSITFHAIGTATLGAAIFLAAQIFNLHENWATGILLWAIGAAAGYLLLRQWPQAAILVLLAPAWLIGQWHIATEHTSGGHRVLSFGLLLTSICYLSALIGDQHSPVRRTLVWIGGIALLPCAGLAIAFANDEFRYYNNSPLPSSTLALFWIVAIAAPLLFALVLRGRAVLMNLVAALWAGALIFAAGRSRHYDVRAGYSQSLKWILLLYLLCALGSVGLIAWGLYEKRKERINLGIAAFALSVLFFYFDSFMGKLGRSFSLLVLGLLCILGGYALEVTRRRLLARMEAAP